MGKYDSFSEDGPFTKHVAGRSGDTRLYVEIMCPKCNVMFLDMRVEQVVTSKASRCKHHIDSGCMWTSLRGPRIVEPDRVPLSDASSSRHPLVDTGARDVLAHAAGSSVTEMFATQASAMREMQDRLNAMNDTILANAAERSVADSQLTQLRCELASLRERTSTELAHLQTQLEAKGRAHQETQSTVQRIESTLEDYKKLMCEIATAVGLELPQSRETMRVRVPLALKDRDDAHASRLDAARHDGEVVRAHAMKLQTQLDASKSELARLRREHKQAQAENGEFRTAALRMRQTIHTLETQTTTGATTAVLGKRRRELLRRFAPDKAHRFENALALATELAQTLNSEEFMKDGSGPQARGR